MSHVSSAPMTLYPAVETRIVLIIDLSVDVLSHPGLSSFEATGVASLLEDASLLMREASRLVGGCAIKLQSK